MKKFLGSALPFLLFHIVCCGGLIIFLATSGYLLVIRQEGNKKQFLIPLLLLGGFFFFLHWYYGRCCSMKGHKTLFDHMMLILFYIGFSMILGFTFMIYLFIPWWIPGYKGGLLLP